MDLPTPPPESLQAALGQRETRHLEPGRAEIAYECGLHMCHSGGVAQGGFVAGWIDAAMAYAIMAGCKPGLVPITLELKVSYFAPANPGIVIAEAWVESAGGRTWFVEGRLSDSAGKVLAKASSTVRLIEAEKVAAMAG